jgi:uncharacterized protein (TIGR02391 family)
VRKASNFTDAKLEPIGGLHPFDERNIHPKLPPIVRNLFDNGYYTQATFEAYKFLDKEVQNLSRLSESGFKLAMQAFAVDAPLIKLTNLSSTSELDEQKGYQFIFAGAMLAVRNPRGHEYSITDSPDKCLDHLTLVSLLLRRLEESGYKIAAQQSVQRTGLRPAGTVRLCWQSFWLAKVSCSSALPLTQTVRRLP